MSVIISAVMSVIISAVMSVIISIIMSVIISVITLPGTGGAFPCDQERDGFDLKVRRIDASEDRAGEFFIEKIKDPAAAPAVDVVMETDVSVIMSFIADFDPQKVSVIDKRIQVPVYR